MNRTVDYAHVNKVKIQKTLFSVLLMSHVENEINDSAKFYECCSLLNKIPCTQHTKTWKVIDSYRIYGCSYTFTELSS